MPLGWQTRLSEMEDWYRDFIRSPDEAARALAYEYDAFSSDLRALSGTILDVGGGAGLARNYLPPDVNYIVVDPSRLWLESAWSTLITRPSFVLGVGEALPFANGSFDAVLSFWSLNHVAEPEQCVSEMYRVLRPDGDALLVLEDMEPSWADVGRLAWQELKETRGHRAHKRLDWGQPGLETARKIAMHKLSGNAWPLQHDHIRLTEANLTRWFRGRFLIFERKWTLKFLTYRLKRCR